jgi:hypothetical protein
MKTSPIGVRFDSRILEKIKREQKLKTHQSILSFLERLYLRKYPMQAPDKRFDKLKKIKTV